jgi:hypothetical protein
MQGTLVQKLGVTCHDLIITLVKAPKKMELDTINNFHQHCCATPRGSKLHKIRKLLRPMNVISEEV